MIFSRRDLARRVPGVHNLHSSIKSLEIISKLVGKLMVCDACDLLMAALLFITIVVLPIRTIKSHQILISNQIERDKNNVMLLYEITSTINICNVFIELIRQTNGKYT